MSFDPYDFRRSAMQVQEPKDIPPPSGGQPQMTERQLPMTPDQQYGQYNEYGFNQQSPYPTLQGPYNGGGAPYNTYGDASPAGNLAGYGAGNMAGQQQQQWAPGQIVSPGMASHYAANPFMNPAPYNESPFTPTGSPAPIQINTNAGANLSRTPSTPSTASTSHYPVAFPASPVDVERSLSRAGTLSRSRSGTLSRSNTLNKGNGTVLAEIGGAAVLTRSTSQKSQGHKKDLSIAVPANPNAHTVMAINTPTSAALPGHLNVTRATADAPVTAQSADDYVDLTRASVSPFQAAQYAEISKRLNTEVPSGMTPPMLEKYVTEKQASELPALPPPSPLSPAPAPAPPVQSMYPAAVVAAASALVPPAQARVRESTDSLTGADLTSFPIPPPSPLLPPTTMSSPTRIDSRPPRLPEIAFRSSTNMSSGWVDTPPASSTGHGDVDSPISPSNERKGPASSLGHGTTWDYHQSFSGPKGGAQGGNGEEIVAPAFPSGISALGGLASPMNGRFNLGAPAVPTPTPAPVAAFQAPQQLSVPPSPAMSASTRMSSTSTVVADDQAASKAATLGKSPLKTELVVVGGVQDVPEGKKQRPETVYDPEDAYGGI